MMQQLKNFAENNPRLVTVRQSTRYPDLQVVKYHRRVFYDALWTPELQEMRGLVVDQDWRPVVRPFTKVFNRGEGGTDLPLDHDVIAIRKINGFMAGYTRDPVHGNIVSTTGSLDSEFSDLARQHLSWLDQRSVPEGLTLLWEIVDPSDPHIVPEQAGAWLIGARWVQSGFSVSEVELDAMADSFGAQALRPETIRGQFRDILRAVKCCRHEGFMVYSQTGEGCLKLKSPYYLVNKLVARKRADRITPQWLASCRETIAEEFYPLLDHLQANLDQFVALDEQARLAYLREYFGGELDRPVL